MGACFETCVSQLQMRTGRTTVADRGVTSPGGCRMAPVQKCPQRWRWVRWVTDIAMSRVEVSAYPWTLGHGGMQGRGEPGPPPRGPSLKPTRFPNTPQSNLIVWALQPKRVGERAHPVLEVLAGVLPHAFNVGNLSLEAQKSAPGTARREPAASDCEAPPARPSAA